MMGGAIPSDIQDEALTREHREGGGPRQHPPYTEALVKRAITEGLAAAS